MAKVSGRSSDECSVQIIGHSRGRCSFLCATGLRRSICPDLLLHSLPGLRLLCRLEHQSMRDGADVLSGADHWPSNGRCLPIRPVETTSAAKALLYLLQRT